MTLNYNIDSIFKFSRVINRKSSVIKRKGRHEKLELKNSLRLLKQKKRQKYFNFLSKLKVLSRKKFRTNSEIKLSSIILIKKKKLTNLKNLNFKSNKGIINRKNNFFQKNNNKNYNNNNINYNNKHNKNYNYNNKNYNNYKNYNYKNYNNKNYKNNNINYNNRYKSNNFNYKNKSLINNNKLVTKIKPNKNLDIMKKKVFFYLKSNFLKSTSFGKNFNNWIKKLKKHTKRYKLKKTNKQIIKLKKKVDYLIINAIKNPQTLNFKKKKNKINFKIKKLQFNNKFLKKRISINSLKYLFSFLNYIKSHTLSSKFNIYNNKKFYSGFKKLLKYIKFIYKLKIFKSLYAIYINKKFRKKKKKVKWYHINKWNNKNKNKGNYKNKRRYKNRWKNKKTGFKIKNKLVNKNKWNIINKRNKNKKLNKKLKKWNKLINKFQQQLSRIHNKNNKWKDKKKKWNKNKVWKIVPRFGFKQKKLIRLSTFKFKYIRFLKHKYFIKFKQKRKNRKNFFLDKQFFTIFKKKINISNNRFKPNLKVFTNFLNKNSKKKNSSKVYINSNSFFNTKLIFRKGVVSSALSLKSIKKSTKLKIYDDFELLNTNSRWFKKKFNFSLNYYKLLNFKLLFIGFQVNWNNVYSNYFNFFKIDFLNYNRYKNFVYKNNSQQLYNQYGLNKFQIKYNRNGMLFLMYIAKLLIDLKVVRKYLKTALVLINYNIYKFSHYMLFCHYKIYENQIWNLELIRHILF